MDDEPFNIMAIKIQLELSPFAEQVLSLLDEAKNGKEAIDKVLDGYQNDIIYGLIFMDCSMPILNGYEASDEIRAFYQSINCQQPKIIACTGHCETEYVQKAWVH